MFIKNFDKIMEKGVPVCPLLGSEVFKLTFDYDEWPATHTDSETIIAPYNGSIFQLRDKYKTIFGEHVEDDDHSNLKNKKLFKIRYTLNILPVIGEYQDVNGML